MKRYRITLNGHVYEMGIELIDEDEDQTKPRTEQKKSTEGAFKATFTNEKPGNESASMTVNSPMPGTIIDVLVSIGDAVKNGQPLIILEAMKMENEITAPADGVIKELLVEKGNIVASGEALCIIE